MFRILNGVVGRVKLLLDFQRPVQVSSTLVWLLEGVQVALQSRMLAVLS